MAPHTPSSFPFSSYNDSDFGMRDPPPVFGRHYPSISDISQPSNQGVHFGSLESARPIFAEQQNTSSQSSGGQQDVFGFSGISRPFSASPSNLAQAGPHSLILPRQPSRTLTTFGDAVLPRNNLQKYLSRSRASNASPSPGLPSTVGTKTTLPNMALFHRPLTPPSIIPDVQTHEAVDTFFASAEELEVEMAVEDDDEVLGGPQPPQEYGSRWEKKGMEAVLSDTAIGESDGCHC
jgi:hypothetical protein